MKEVHIEYDFNAYDVIEEIYILLRERGLTFEERWEDTDLFLSIVDIVDIKNKERG